MSTPPINAWTPERVERLKELLPEGLSYAQIAKALGGGLSRNAVLGKVHRLNLRYHGPGKGALPPGDPKPVKRRPKKPRKPPVLTPLPYRPEISADAPPPRAAAFMALPGTTPKSLIDLATRGECRWPIGENPTLFCGCAADGVYCATHAAMAYRPLEKADK